MSVRDLVIPAPLLLAGEGDSATPYEAGVAILWDKAMSVRCGAPKTADGTLLPLTAIRRLGFVVSKISASGEQIFDLESEAWGSFDPTSPAGESVELGPLEPRDEEDASAGWQGLGALADNQKYPRPSADRYAARAYFEAVVEEETHFGWSPIATVHPIAENTSLYAGLSMEDGEKPSWLRAYMLDPDSRRVRSELFLQRRSPAGVLVHVEDGTERVAQLRILESGRIELETHPTDGSRSARVVLEPDGRVEISSATGEPIVLNTLEVEPVTGGLRVRANSGALILDGPVRVDGDLHVAGTLTANHWSTP